MKRRIAMWLLVAAGLVLFNQETGANGIVVANASLWNPSLGQSNVYVSVDISWSNSWRTAQNWDAAWVFVKFKAPGSNDWQHAKLSANSSDHIMPAGCTNTPAPDGTGVFIYRSDIATGGVSFAQIKLKWNYGTANGYTFNQGDQIPISVQAIEMVYVPTGAFYLGSTGNETARFYAPPDAGMTNAFLVSSTNAITVGSSGNLYYSATGVNYGDGSGPIPNTFPNGYNAFYCMKYEISQGQYMSFLNLLTRSQQSNRCSAVTVGRFMFSDNSWASAQNRNEVSLQSDPGGTTSKVFACTAPDRACNFLSWADGAAYADWAGLRPMAELEFEKACRGFANPSSNEYAWGSTTITQLTAEVAGNTGTSTVSTLVGANCCYNNAAGIQGPTRCGIFATASSGRVQAGATYWGIMEMSGNLNERPVTVGNATGRSFQGTHGDGALTVDGYATNTDWPPSSTATGSGIRGGGYYNASGLNCVSDRTYAAITYTTRNSDGGWRAVRLAP